MLRNVRKYLSELVPSPQSRTDYGSHDDARGGGRRGGREGGSSSQVTTSGTLQPQSVQCKGK